MKGVLHMSTTTGSLAGKVAIITGGGTGLGQTMALRLAEEGCDIVVGARRVGAIEETAALVRDIGPRGLAIATDATDSAQCNNLIARTIAEFGRLDILINNAGIVRDQPFNQFWDITDEQWRLGIDTNLTTAFYCSRPAIKYFVEQNRGKVINIASGNGMRGQRGDFMYGTAKAGVINLTRIMAMSFATNNIQVNCIAPGFIDVRHLQPGAGSGPTYDSGRNPKFIPVGRFGVPDDIGHLGLFLSSDASDSITGGLFACDGGGLASGIAPTGYVPVFDLKEN